MSRTKLSLAVLLVVALVVALEEWRIAGWRGRATKAEQDLALALADLPPPPRPEDKGDANSVVGVSRIRRIKERSEEQMAGETVADGVETEVAAGEPAEVAPAVANEPAAAEAVDYRQLVQHNYGALIDSFQLNDTERAYFVQLLADGIKFQGSLLGARASATTVEARAAAEEKIAQAQQDIGGKIRHFLGNDRDYAIFQAYAAKLAEQSSGQ